MRGCRSRLPAVSRVQGHNGLGDSCRGLGVQLVTTADMEPLLGGEGSGCGGRRLLMDMRCVDHRRVANEPIVVWLICGPWLLDPVSGAGEPTPVDRPRHDLGVLEAEVTAGFAYDPLQSTGRGGQCLGMRADLGRLSCTLGADGDMDASQSNLRHSMGLSNSVAIHYGSLDPNLWISRRRFVDRLGRTASGRRFARQLQERSGRVTHTRGSSRTLGCSDIRR